MNIELQCCALLMLAVLLVLYLQESGVKLRSRKLFLLALLANVLCLSLDILSIVGIWGATYRSFPETGAEIICKLYVMALALQTYLGFLYASNEFFAGNSHRGIRYGYLAVFLVGEVLIASLPIEYYMDGRVVYSSGPSPIATYAVSLVFIVSTILMAFYSKDRSSSRRRRAILLWQGSWLLAAAVQFLNRELLVVGFAAAFGMVLLYAELENPHAFIDRNTGLLTANTLVDQVNDLYLRGRDFACVYIRFVQEDQRENSDRGKLFLIRVSNELLRVKGVRIFRKSDNEIVLFFRNKDAMDNLRPRIALTMQDASREKVRLERVVVPNGNLMQTAAEFFQMEQYLALKAEKQGIVVADEEEISAFHEYANVIEMIKTALAQGRVEVYYQPFYRVLDGKFTAAEALVRIRNENGEIVPPGRFIRIAEETGLIVPLGKEVFRQVCEFLGTGVPQKLGIEHIEVNLSIAQFDEENPSVFVQDILERYQVKPELVNLEITETALPNVKKFILKNMEALIEKGVTFSLDDFGTGRSNLDYFLEMPVKIIKFDYSFTHRYFTSERARTVMDSLVSLMHRTGMELVSEGVETSEQFEAMRALKIEYIQGFYFSKPLPRDEFVRFLERHI